MQQHTTNSARMTVGLDVGDRYSYLCVLDAAGVVVEEGRIPTTRAAIRRRFLSADRMRVVLETGTHSAWISRGLEELGHEVLVANARRLRLIAEHDAKSDRVMRRRWRASDVPIPGCSLQRLHSSLS